MAADAGVGSVMIVSVEPGGVGGGAGFVGDVGVGVGPFGGQGAVETFDLAVGLGPVGARPHMLDVAEGRREVAGPVAGPVVGHHCGDGDSRVGEELVGPGPECGGGLLLLIAQDLGVGEAGVVVDSVVEERVAATATAVAVVVSVASLSTQHAVAAAVGDAALLLDVHVHQLPGPGLLVSDRAGPPHGQPGGLVEMVQQRHRIPLQHPAHRRAGNMQVVTDAMRTPSASEPQRHDAPLQPPRAACRGATGPTRAVRHRLSRPIPGRPFRGRRRRALESLGRTTSRPPLLHHQAGKAQTPHRRQRSISVDHEDLRWLM